MWQELDIKINYKKGSDNHIANNLSILESSSNMQEQRQMMEEFIEKKLLELEVTELPWYADIVNYLDSGLFPPGAY